MSSPIEVAEFLESIHYNGRPSNLEEKAVSLVGDKIYNILIKGYTEKQWGKDCRELSPDIITRLPVRLTFDNNYFDDIYQGIPIGGYSKWINNILNGIQVMTDTDFLTAREFWKSKAEIVIPAVSSTNISNSAINPSLYCPKNIHNIGKLEKNDSIL